MTNMTNILAFIIYKETFLIFGTTFLQKNFFIITEWDRPNVKELVWSIRTANEEQVRFQYMVPIYVFPEMKLHGIVISKKECSVSRFLHSCICEYFIDSQDRSAYFAPAQ
jgi:hypothetical protein